MPLNPKAKLIENILDFKTLEQKSAQDMQDDIFRKMPADKKLEVAAKFWLLAKAIDPDKIDFRMAYGRNRPASFID